MDAKTPWPQTIRIGSSEIGPGRPLYVIAEAGVNHNGDLSMALDMVKAAAAAGADAVKFQLFSAERLVTHNADAAGYQKTHSQREMLARLELHPEDFTAIASQCAATGIEFILTPFSIEDVALLGDLGVGCVKVASPDVANPPLLQAVAATGLPVLLSTGGATLEEVDAALKVLADGGARDAALLQCVSSYPTPLDHAALRGIRALVETFGMPVGYSDHTTELITGELAVGVGACILEKHFTLDPTLPGPDHALSLRPVELTAYIVRARRAAMGELDESQLDDVERRALGSEGKEPSEIERDVMRVARSSVTSTVFIPAGTTITREMLTVKRPGGGIPPGQLDAVVGRSAGEDIPPDTTLRPGMLR